MKAKVRDFFGKKKNWTYIILFIIIVAQVSYITYCFEVKKKDFHSDEIWSYGPANSYDYPFFYVTRDWSDTQHFDEWIDGSEMNSYLAVDEGEQFAYNQIYENTSKDLHQPLYFWILHTICSFFPGSFSWWYAFSLNLLFFVLGQVFLFLMIKKITDNDFVALMVCILYGFSQGAVNNTVYIRMYSMITTLGIISMYLHALLYKEPQKIKRVLPAIWIVTFLGGITHSFFLVFACGLAACFCFYYLFKKEFKYLFIYAGTLLSAAIAVFLLYPSTIEHALLYNERNNVIGGSGAENTTSKRYGGFAFEFRWLVTHMCQEVFGVYVAPYPGYGSIYAIEVLLVLCVIGIPTAFLFRKEEWFKKGIRKIVTKIKGIPMWLSKKCDWLKVFMAVIVIFDMLITARMAHIFEMGELSTRYVFVIYPYLYSLIIFIAIIVINAVAGFVKSICVKRNIQVMEHVVSNCKKIMLIVLILPLLINITVNGTKAYYFDYEDTADLYLTELPRDANYVLNLRYNFLLDSLCNTLNGIENFYAVIGNDIFYQAEELNKLKSDKPVYLILPVPAGGYLSDEEGQIEIDKEFDNEITDLRNIEHKITAEYLDVYEVYFRRLSICTEFTYIGVSEVFGRPVFVFKIRS